MSGTLMTPECSTGFSLPVFKFAFIGDKLIVSDEITDMREELNVSHFALVQEVDSGITDMTVVVTGNLFRTSNPLELRIASHCSDCGAVRKEEPPKLSKAGPASTASSWSTAVEPLCKLCGSLRFRRHCDRTDRGSVVAGHPRVLRKHMKMCLPRTVSPKLETP
jgi:hypothetical protein